MRLQRTIVALGTLSVVLMLGLVVVWGGAGTATVGAQTSDPPSQPPPTEEPTPTPTLEVVEPAALTETVETDWGS